MSSEGLLSTVTLYRGLNKLSGQEARISMLPRHAIRIPVLFLSIVAWTTAVRAVDNQPPICDSSISGSGATAIVNGTATDKGPGQTGIVSVVLEGSFVNLACQGCTTTLSPPASKVTFSLSLADPGTPSGRGTVTVSDASGNTCNVSASYVPIAQGLVSNLPLVLDPARAVKLYVEDGSAPASGVAVTAYTLPTQDDVRCLPTCFEFQPGTQALTVDSPIEGVTGFALDTPGNNNVRMLSRHLNECFLDFSESVQGLVFDPRVRSCPPLSRVEFATGRQIAGCVATKKGDRDGDGFFFGGSTPAASADCNDANPNINPGAAEVCNGIDDDCDGAVDEGLVCGAVQITAKINTTGSDSLVNSQPLPGTEVRLYDASPGSCAELKGGNSPKSYCAIYGEGTFSNPGCVSVTSGLTDAQGLVSFTVAPGYYLAIGRPPAPHEDTKIGATVGNVSAGGSAQKQIQLVIDQDGNETPSRNCQ